MLKKLLLRGFVACAAVSVSAVLATAVAIYFAVQEPRFYVERVAFEPTAAERDAVKMKAEQIARSVTLWSQLRQISDDASAESVPLRPEQWPVAVFGDQPARSDVPADPLAETWSVTFTERELNTLVALNKFGLDEINRPVFRLQNGRASIGFRLDTPNFDGVISCDTRLSPTDSGDLRIDILSGRVGQLPIPLTTILKSLPKSASSRNRDLDLRFDDEIPHVILHLNIEAKHQIVLEGLRTDDGSITVEFRRADAGREGV